MRLHDIAHARAGDKGDTLSIAVIVYDIADFALVERQVTAEKVRERFAALRPESVERYALPHLGALNFVLRGALSGGVTRSLALDAHGKTLGAKILDIEIPEQD